TLMAVVYFAGRALDHRGPSLNSLAVAAALLAIGDPLSIGEPSFILTCGATLGILEAAPVAQQVSGPRVVRPAVAMLVASAATEAMLMPVGAIVFSRVTFAGLGL